MFQEKYVETMPKTSILNFCPLILMFIGMFLHAAIFTPGLSCWFSSSLILFYISTLLPYLEHNIILCLFCYWSCSNFHYWELFKVGFSVLLTCPFLSICFSFLLSGTTLFLRLIFYFPFPVLESTTSPNNLGSFCWRTTVRNHDLGTRCGH